MTYANFQSTSSWSSWDNDFDCDTCSVSIVASESLVTQFILATTVHYDEGVETISSNLNIGNYINTQDLYICTGVYVSQSDGFMPTTGDCDLSRKSVKKGETYYFFTTSSVYDVKIDYPLGYGAIAGIVIGAVVLLSCCCVSFIIVNNKKKKSPTQQNVISVVELSEGQVQENPVINVTNTI